MLHPRFHAERDPDRIAYRMADDGAVLSFGALEDAANRGAQTFRSLGLGTGAVVAALMENCLDFMVAAWAAQRSGICFVPVSRYLTASEITFILQDSGAQALVVSPRQAAIAEELVDAGTAPPHVLATGGAAASGMLDWDDCLAAMPADSIRDESTGINMGYSSGTTGRPKGVRPPATDRAVEEPDPFMLHLVRDRLGMSAASTFLSPAPLYHAAPMRFNMMCGHLGATSSIMTKFDPVDFLDTIARQAITHTKCVPTMFVRLLKLPEEVRLARSVASLETVVHAAAPCPVEIKRRMIAWLGPIIHEYYAGTESNGLTFISCEEWLEHPASVGRAVIGTPHIMDESGETELAPGDTGLVYFDGGVQFAYHNDPEATRKAYNRRGWSTVGDIGRLDAGGYLYLTDRQDFMIITGGVNVSPQEVEDTIVQHPGVRDVAVFGLPDPDLGQRVFAVVQPVDEETGDRCLGAAILAYCRTRLSSVKCPREIEIRRDLPRTETGKMLKARLQQEYFRRTGEQR